MRYDINDICEKSYVIALPIKVGDKVYVDLFPNEDRELKNDNYPRNGEIASISLNKFSAIFSVEFDSSEKDAEDDFPIVLHFSLNDINKRVFLKK